MADLYGSCPMDLWETVVVEVHSQPGYGQRLSVKTTKLDMVMGIKLPIEGGDGGYNYSAGQQ